MKMVVKCIKCGKEVDIKVTPEQEKELSNPNRRKIQEILPDHTPEEREMFASGLCEKCWDDIFNEFNCEESPEEE
jgi:hypothetical protein